MAKTSHEKYLEKRALGLCGARNCTNQATIGVHCASCHEKYRQYRSARKRQWRGYGLKRRFGITPDQFDALLERQGARCAICLTQDFGTRGPQLDHLETQIRGILCWNCNSALGHLKEDPEIVARALKYLAVRDAHILGELVDHEVPSTLPTS